MLAYTAVDGLNLVSRAFGRCNAQRERGAVSLAPHSHRPISAAAIQALQRRTGHDHPVDALDTLSLLTTGPAIGAWVGEQLVGIAHTRTDAHNAAVIDLLVDPTYRHQGIGAALRTRLRAQLAGLATIAVR